MYLIQQKDYIVSYKEVQFNVMFPKNDCNFSLLIIKKLHYFSRAFIKKNTKTGFNLNCLNI